MIATLSFPSDSDDATSVIPLHTVPTLETQEGALILREIFCVTALPMGSLTITEKL
jgi:hypothetical protein